MHDCRRGIEGLNDELLTRGFAMNEEGGILKASHPHHLPLLSRMITNQAKDCDYALHSRSKQSKDPSKDRGLSFAVAYESGKAACSVSQPSDDQGNRGSRGAWRSRGPVVSQGVRGSKDKDKGVSGRLGWSGGS